MISDSAFWMLTIGLGIGTFLIRFSFLGLFGSRQLPEWAMLHLKYVGVAVFPAMITPLVLWPAATGGVPDPLRMIAGGLAFLAGLRFGVIPAIIAGMGGLWVMQALWG